MDEDRPIPPTRRRAAGGAAGLLNCLTVVMLLLTCLGAAGVAMLFRYPGILAFVPGGSAYMPPPEPATAVALVTPTPEPISTDASGLPIYPTFPPTWTPESSSTPGSPTASATAAPPTATETRTPTATRPPASATPTGPTPTAVGTSSTFRYTLQPGNPTYLDNFLNNQGCNWFGVVGQAFDVAGNPVNNLTVHLEGGDIKVDALTGSGPAAIGPGGYQIPIADHPITTVDVYHISLRDNTGVPLSDVYAIPTFGDCHKVMVMVNFVRNH